MRFALLWVMSGCVLGGGGIDALLTCFAVESPIISVSASHADDLPVDCGELPIRFEGEEEAGKKASEGADEIPWGLASMQRCEPVASSAERSGRSCLASSSASPLHCLKRLRI
jgi:hypothetical protein